MNDSDIIMYLQPIIDLQSYKDYLEYVAPNCEGCATYKDAIDEVLRNFKIGGKA